MQYLQGPYGYQTLGSNPIDAALCKMQDESGIAGPASSPQQARSLRAAVSGMAPVRPGTSETSETSENSETSETTPHSGP